MSMQERPWQKSYTMAESPPPPMLWVDYKALLIHEWSLLLQSESAHDESVVHAFLEKHPCLLPGAFSFPPSGHFPIRCALITKPPLSAEGNRIPDFMWIAVSSSTLWPVLIEIEAPNKRWFNSRGIPTQKFTAASTQLAQWNSWFNKPANQQTFLNVFQVPANYQQDLHFMPQFVLIYGRRHEFDKNPSLRHLRASLQRDNEYHITFDRLQPQQDCSNFICIRKALSAFEAVAVPPTLALGPSYAEPWHDIKHREESISSCEWMTTERKTFLIQRLAYWDDWVKSGMEGCTEFEQE